MRPRRAKWSWLAPALLLAASAAMAAPEGQGNPLAAGLAALRLGIDRGDVPTLMKARGEFLAASAADPKGVWPHYYVGLADWWLVAIQSSKEEKRKDAERLADEGIERCERALALEGRNAEALALKGSLQGMSIRFRPAAAIMLGPAARENLERAKQLAPESPRVWVLSGINTLHMPSFFGGGAEPALKEFQQAESLFARAAPAASDGAAGPDWGRDDAPLWAGRAQMQLKSYEAARRSFHRALEANPNNGWVRSSLLPEAEKALAGAVEGAK